MSKVFYNKLVRDNIPAIIEKSGKKPNYHVLSQDEFKDALKAKLVEEVNEFLKAETEDAMIEEVADIHEVLSAIKETFRLSHIGVYYYAIDKREDKGGFNKRYLLESVED